MDPLAEKYPAWSPYNYVMNNPLGMVDPDGRDWYRAQNGAIRYNPELKKSNAHELLKEGEEYLWPEKSIDNGSLRYKTDGAVFFADEHEAYKYLTAIKDKERFGVFLKSGILVLPDYKNNESNSYVSEYNYQLSKGKISNKGANWEEDVMGTIHTHPSEKFAIPSGIVEGFAIDDWRFMTYYYPEKLHLVVGLKDNPTMNASIWYASENSLVSIHLPNSVNRPYNGQDVFFVPLKKYRSMINSIIPNIVKK